MRSLHVCCLAVLFAAPLVAQHQADPDKKVRFLVNGNEVNASDASAVDAAGIAGLRINHNLNVHVEGFAVKSR